MYCIFLGVSSISFLCLCFTFCTQTHAWCLCIYESCSILHFVQFCMCVWKSLNIILGAIFCELCDSNAKKVRLIPVKHLCFLNKFDKLFANKSKQLHWFINDFPFTFVLAVTRNDVLRYCRDIVNTAVLPSTYYLIVVIHTDWGLSLARKKENKGSLHAWHMLLAHELFPSNRFKCFAHKLWQYCMPKYLYARATHTLTLISSPNTAAHQNGCMQMTTPSRKPPIAG